MAAGRPTTYNEEIANEICAAIATGTESIHKLCPKFEHWPHPSTVYLWRLTHKEFSDKYVRAKQEQADLLAESIDDIANETAYFVDEHGNEKMDHAYIADKRLRIDTRKWIACKLLPKVYGDKQTIDQTITINHEDALKELE